MSQWYEIWGTEAESRVFFLLGDKTKEFEKGQRIRTKGGSAAGKYTIESVSTETNPPRTCLFTAEPITGEEATHLRKVSRTSEL